MFYQTRDYFQSMGVYNRYQVTKSRLVISRSVSPSPYLYKDLSLFALRVVKMKFLFFFCLTAGLVVAQRVSAPDCTGGSKAECVCGDGSQPDYSRFPPCQLKKV